MPNKQNPQLAGLFEKPNTPLITWAVCLFIGKILNHTTLQDSTTDRLIELIGFGALFTWAWLELFQGRNWFRRILGFTVLVIIISSRI